MDRIQIVDCDVDILVEMRLPLRGIIVTIGLGIVAGKDNPLEVEVMAPGRYAFPSIIEDGGIELRGRVNVPNRQNDPVKFHESELLRCERRRVGFITSHWSSSHSWSDRSSSLFFFSSISNSARSFPSF